MADDSDSEWIEEEAADSDVSSAPDDDPPPLTGRATRGVSAAEDTSGLAALLTDEEPITTTIQRLEAVVCCSKLCFVGKRAAVTQFLTFLRAMTEEEQRTSLLTALAMCAAFSGKTTNERERFGYYVPLVGHVCKSAFESAYGVSHRTLHLYRKRVREGAVNVQRHGAAENTNAQILDEDIMASWFIEFADHAGDVVPVRVRLREQKDGTLRRFYSFDNYTLLPPSFTWDKLLAEYVTNLDDTYVDTPRPSRTSFVRVLGKRCPSTRIRSGRDQVCDQCAIYRSKMGPEVDAVDTEVFGDHLTDAKALRTEYKIDSSTACKDKLVFVMDYAQNLSVPHVPDTPSGWYFLSLFSVSMFGIYCANTSTHSHFLYSERKGGKGANEVISMLHHTLGKHGVFDGAYSDASDAGGEDQDEAPTVVVWCDNCGGQNKNSFVVWYLLYLVECGFLRAASLKFFEKGHTKNACDRGFAHVKRHLAKESCWTVDCLVEAVGKASKAIETVNLDEATEPFWHFKSFLEPRYKKVTGIQKFQTFTMTREVPRHVECRRNPSSEPTVLNLGRTGAGPAPTVSTFASAWKEATKLSDLPPNPEKQLDLYAKIRPYVPAEFTNDPLYQKPAADVETTARDIKRQRQQKAKRKRKQKTDDDEGKESVV